MKTNSFVVVCAIAAAFQFAPVANAQSPDDEDQGQRGGRHSRKLGNLSADERQKFRNAQRQAMADPAVKAARDRYMQAAKDFRDLKRARMLEADPSLQRILDKMPARRKHGR